MSKPTTRYKVLVSDFTEPYQFYIHATGRKDAAKQMVERLELNYPFLDITSEWPDLNKIYVFGKSADGVVVLSASGDKDE